MTFSSDDLPVPLRPIRPSRSPASSDERRAVEQGDVAVGEVGVGERENGHGGDADAGAPARLAPGERALERVDEHLGDVEAGLLGDLLEAGRAGDVDLGQAVADHVEPDQQQAARAPASGRSPRRSRGRAPSSGCATPLPPAARLPRISLPCGMRASAIRHRLAADHQDALVALRRSRAGSAAPSPSCAPSRLSVSMMRAEVQAVGADAEDAHAAHAVERLQDDVAGARRGSARIAVGVARDERRRDELRELEDRELLRDGRAAPRGWLKTRAPSRSACSSRWVA